MDDQGDGLTTTTTTLFSHVRQLVIDLSVHEGPPLADELGLQSLLDQGAHLLLCDRVEIDLAKHGLDSVNDGKVVRTDIAALEVEGQDGLVGSL